MPGDFEEVIHSSKLTKKQKKRRFLIKASVASLATLLGGFYAYEHRRWLKRKMRVLMAKLENHERGPDLNTPEAREYKAFLEKLNLRHIKPHEIINAHSRERNGVKNTLPPKSLWKNIVHTLRVADEIRERLGVKLEVVASAYRSPEYNAQCPGAVKGSQHTHNVALDLVFDCKSDAAHKVAVALRDEGFFEGGIGLYPSFIHVDTRGYNCDWA